MDQKEGVSGLKKDDAPRKTTASPPTPGIAGNRNSEMEAGQSKRSPMYEALNTPRYLRQELIKQIESRRGRRLICYVAGPKAHIDREDTLGFVELLHDVSKGSGLDLLVHTGGGDIDAAEKLSRMVRATVQDGCLNAIVPDFAKSAGTLMTLAADKIVMSDVSELGPIDPQFRMDDGRGNRMWLSVLNYLDAYATHSEELLKNPDNVAAQIMLGKLDPSTIKSFEAVKERTRNFAERSLKYGMLRTKGGNFTKIVSDLMDIKRWQTHGQMIGYEDAQQIGLEVEYLEPGTTVWPELWRLYCLQRLAIGDGEKLYESNYVSYVVQASG